MNLVRDILRAFRTHKWERTETGIEIFSKLPIGGMMGTRLVSGPTFEANGPEAMLNHNMVVTEGLIYDVAVALMNGAKIANWYLAPFKNNVAPQLTWTAANFNSNAGEFTNYTEATRPGLVYPDPTTLTTPVAANDATTITTVGGGADKTLWGGGIISASAKSATSGKLWGAVQFGAARSGLQTGDALAWTYQLTAGNQAP